MKGLKVYGNVANFKKKKARCERGHWFDREKNG